MTVLVMSETREARGLVGVLGQGGERRRKSVVKRRAGKTVGVAVSGRRVGGWGGDGRVGDGEGKQ